MAGSTTNYGLTKPLGSEYYNISVPNGNMDKIDTALGGLGAGLAIVANGNTHGAVSSGQFVYVHGHGTLAEGLYKATAAISANATLSGSNLAAVSGGGLNALKATATTSADGLMSSTDKTKLNGVESGANNYTLPTAASGTKGGIQLGYSQSGKNYPVQVSDEKAYVNVPWTDTTYSDATTSTHGLMSTADKTKLNGIANNANNYSLPMAASGTRGGIQLGYSQSGKKYPVQVSGEKAYVEVPWTDTTYSNATTSTAGLMSAADKTKLNGVSTGANKVQFQKVTVSKSLTLAENSGQVFTATELGYTIPDGYTPVGLAKAWALYGTVAGVNILATGSTQMAYVVNTFGAEVTCNLVIEVMCQKIS